MEVLSQKELKRMFFVSWERIEKEKENINKINVFPVPDQDTGNNLAKTLFGIKEALERKEPKNLEDFSNIVLEAALSSAQGNAGVIYTGFLAGFLTKINGNIINASKLADAFEEGAKRAQKSILDPKEGTILDVIDATALVFKKEAEKEKNIILIFEKAIEAAKEALLNTREKMDILKKANVVDAGGLGFLMILESYLQSLSSVAAPVQKTEIPSEKIKRFVQFLSHRFEIVALLDELEVEEEKVKERLGKLGNSLDIVKIGNKMKIHIHTDYPEEVKKEIKLLGKVEDLREEDMAKEVVGEPSVKKISIGIVTENIASILPKILERYQIEVANAKFDWPELENIEGENIYQKIKKAYELGIKTRPKTSQATPKDYFDAFKIQLQRFDKVLCLTLSSKISGCYSSAIQAREMLVEKERQRVFVFDTLNGAAGQALFVLRAIELAQEGLDISKIIEKLKKTREKTYFYIIFADPRGVEFIGRITKNQADWIRKMKKIGIQPLIQLQKGILGKRSVVFAKTEVQAIFKKFMKDSKRQRKLKKRIRVIINHAENLEGAKKLKELLKNVGVEVSFISEASPIICAATGPGTLALGWQIIE